MRFTQLDDGSTAAQHYSHVVQLLSGSSTGNNGTGVGPVDVLFNGNPAFATNESLVGDRLGVPNH